MLVKLSEGNCCSDSCFSSDFKVEHYNIKLSITKVKIWDNDNKFQCYQEAMTWMGCRGNEIDNFFKVEKISIHKRY